MSVPGRGASRGSASVVINSVATLVFKAFICIKARDALVVSCHRDAAAVGAGTVGLLRQVPVRLPPPHIARTNPAITGSAFAHRRPRGELEAC